MEENRKPLIISTASVGVKIAAVIWGLLAIGGILMIVFSAGDAGLVSGGISLIVIGVVFCLDMLVLTSQKIIVYPDAVACMTIMACYYIPIDEISTYGFGFGGRIFIGSSSRPVLVSTYWDMSNSAKVVGIIRELKAGTYCEDEAKPAAAIKAKKDKDSKRYKEIIYRDCFFEGTIDTDSEEEVIINAITRLEQIAPYKDAEKLIEQYRALVNDYEAKRDEAKEGKLE